MCIRDRITAEESKPTAESQTVATVQTKPAEEKTADTPATEKPKAEPPKQTTTQAEPEKQTEQPKEQMCIRDRYCSAPVGKRKLVFLCSFFDHLSQ